MGDKIIDLAIILKILRTLSIKFDPNVIAIEESKDLGATTINELHRSLEAYEQRLFERSSEKPSLPG